MILTLVGMSWYIYIMSRIIDILKKTITDSGMSHLRIEKECGVNRLSIGRFMSGKTLLSLEQVEMLAEYFGLALLPETKKKRTRKGS